MDASIVGATDWAHVRVPATSANLGPGFDALGLALDLVDDVSARLTDRPGTLVEVTGEGADSVPRDGTNLVVTSLRTAADVLGLDARGVQLRAVNRIPHARGLGSSAAAICAGVVLAFRLAGHDGNTPPLDGVLSLAGAIEGHPDNVAACLLGGLTVAWTDDEASRACRLEPHPAVRPVVLVPDTTASTAAARAALPTVVPHADAALNAGRSALLVAALTAEPRFLFEATEDRLHQAYRAPGQPAAARLVADLRNRGFAAVISGAGPTVLVLAPDDDVAAQAVLAAPPGWSVRRPAIASDGAWTA